VIPHARLGVEERHRSGFRLSKLLAKLVREFHALDRSPGQDVSGSAVRIGNHRNIPSIGNARSQPDAMVGESEVVDAGLDWRGNLDFKDRLSPLGIYHG